MDRDKLPAPNETSGLPKEKRDDQPARTKETVDTEKPNPPRTTAGGITAPKFGSAGSGGAEYEPGPERD